MLAADSVLLLDLWTRGIAALDQESLLSPTPSRGRSLRALTVNVHHPFEILPAAWPTGSFPWDPDRDGDREVGLTTAAAVRAYAAGVLTSWRSFVTRFGAELDTHDPVIATPRGDVPYSVVLDTQRWHAAYHLRQLEAVTDQALLPDLDALALPVEVF